MWSNLISILSQLVLLTVSAFSCKRKKYIYMRHTDLDNKLSELTFRTRQMFSYQTVERSISISSASARADEMKLQEATAGGHSGMITQNTTGAFILVEAVKLESTTLYSTSDLYV